MILAAFNTWIAVPVAGPTVWPPHGLLCVCVCDVLVCSCIAHYSCHTFLPVGGIQRTKLMLIVILGRIAV